MSFQLNLLNVTTNLTHIIGCVVKGRSLVQKEDLVKAAQAFGMNVADGCSVSLDSFSNQSRICFEPGTPGPGPSGGSPPFDMGILYTNPSELNVTEFLDELCRDSYGGAWIPIVVILCLAVLFCLFVSFTVCRDGCSDICSSVYSSLRDSCGRLKQCCTFRKDGSRLTYEEMQNTALGEGLAGDEGASGPEGPAVT